MKKQITVKQIYLLGIIFVFILSSCGTQNVLTKAQKSGVKLEYAFPAEYVNYKLDQKIDQEIDAMGQLINIDVLSELDFVTKKNADEGANTRIDIKINNIDMGIDAMGQQMGPDLSELKGKEFHLVVSKKGKEVDTHEADEIVFQVSPDERSNLGLIFNSVFPDLPDGVVKIDDSWKSKDSIYFKDGERYTQIITNNTHTLVNFIELEGVNCAEVKTVYKGYLKGKSFSQGQELTVDGTISGEGTWYFDFEKGMLVKDHSIGLADGKISMAMGEMSMKRKFDNTTELVK